MRWCSLFAGFFFFFGFIGVAVVTKFSVGNSPALAKPVAHAPALAKPIAPPRRGTGQASGTRPAGTGQASGTQPKPRTAPLGIIALVLVFAGMAAGAISPVLCFCIELAR